MTTKTAMTLNVRNVSCAFKYRTIIHDLTAHFTAGQLTALTGASGSGKTTLLNMLGGLIVPDTGSIEFDGHNLATMSSRARRKFRRANVGYLFQDYGLVSDLTVEENIKIAVPRVSSEALAAVLADVGLGGSEKRTVSELSGGEQQRIALARLILSEPNIVLADEPTGALDEENSHLVLNKLRQFARNGAVVVVATHSAYIADNADAVVKL
ncbi:ATP-binding cassette domain-containing protein [uncultured Corynebacterium sp.]|uniref:ABC transporter ATP-binding protein n=1 Tax=Corynebacterium sp. YSMAA5_1_F9 TaxID=3383591 RepID=UPI0025E1559D|nr:ATP-binding cassette domain-containing protein [uncultured Corynebacterium sp.]